MSTSASSPGSNDLTQERVSALLAEHPGAWRDVTVVAATGSTNADLLRRAAAGAREGAVIAAGQQTSGRGRLSRVWESPAGSTLSFSVLLTPPADKAAFIPVLTAVAVARAISRLGGIEADLKWPNDVMLGDEKVAGILAEGGPAGAVVGCGINVSIPADALPVPTATSLQLHGAVLDRAELLVACLEELRRAVGRWREAGYSAEASGLLTAYRASCGTIGRRVRAMLPDGTDLFATATGIDDLGRLLLRTDTGPVALTAGDIVHLRSAR